MLHLEVILAKVQGGRDVLTGTERLTMKRSVFVWEIIFGRKRRSWCPASWWWGHFRKWSQGTDVPGSQQGYRHNRRGQISDDSKSSWQEALQWEQETYCGRFRQLLELTSALSIFPPESKRIFLSVAVITLQLCSEIFSVISKGDERKTYRKLLNMV